MPLPTNNSRPAIPYNPEQVLPNHNRYEALGKFPPTAQELDGDFNGMVDLINTLAEAINDTAAGIFPGADNPLNADKLPTTDGQGNVSWTHVTPFNLADNAVQTRHISDAAITHNKIQAHAVGTNQIADGAVTMAKMPDNAVVTAKIADHAVTTAKISPQAITAAQIAPNTVTATQIANHTITATQIADNAIATAKIPDNAVTTAKVPDRAITAPKINSDNAALGDLLTANGAGAASFLANKGRVLQIVSYEDGRFVRNEYDAAATPQNLLSFKTAPFLLKITPQKTNSKILIFYSINVGAGSNQHASITLCKNNVPFKVGTDDAPSSYWGVTHSIYSSAGLRQYSNGQYGCFNFSSLFMDTGISGTEIAYEVKKANPYTGLNSGYSGSHTSVSVMHAIEIDL